MADRNALLHQLKQLSLAQFEEVLFRLEVEPWIIPGVFAEQGLRATAVIRRLEQEANGSGLKRLSEALADRTLETIGKQYEGYETEAEVRKVVGEYVQQPIAGRSQEQEQIDQFLANNSSGMLLVTAPAGFGKSSLLMHWQESKQEDYFIAFHCFRTASSVLRSVTNAYRHLLRQLYVYYNRRDQQFPSDLRSQLRGLVDDAGVQPDKRLVIVLDGLDEAQETLEPFLSSPLPDGVYVIASARAGQEDEPEYLKGWTANAQRLLLKRLPREAIADWVAKINPLAPYAQNPDFIVKLDEVTLGFPLYLRYLLEDLKQAVAQGKDIQVFLTNSPTGFAAYVKQQFGQLTKEVKQEKEVQELFVLLSVALGALSADDIEALTGLGVFDLPNLPWQVTRWFSIRSDSQLDFYNFAHPLLADEFQEVLGKKQTEPTRTKLMRYCADWQENESPYALRYYAEHLQEAKQVEPLYELARNEAFANAQRQGIPDEPELPLKTIKLALQSKAVADDARGMAELLLLHAKHKIEIAQESPLDALRAGNLERAWKLAEQSSREDCILWHLLLAWALFTGNKSDSKSLEPVWKTLGRLQTMQLPRLSDWKAEYAVYLLEKTLFVPKVLQEQEANLDQLSFIQQVLADEKLQDLYEGCIKALVDFAIVQAIAGDAVQTPLNTALTTAEQIKDSSSKAKALTAIAIAQVKVGDPAAALTTVEQIEPFPKAVALKEVAIAQANAGDVSAILTIAEQTEDPLFKAWALKEIAIAQANAGDISAALTIAEQIKDSSSKAKVLTAIAIAQANAGDAAALTTAAQIKDSSSKVGALTAIAIAQANAGDATAAQTTLNTALLTTAEQIRDPSSKAWALKEIAIAQANAGDAAAQTTLNTALTTAEKIEDPSSKAWALKEIAIAQAKAGDVAAAQTTLNTALTTAEQMENPLFKAQALKEIAIAQATTLKEIAIAQVNAGDAAAALTTAQQIKDLSFQAETLKEIAIAQVNAGDAAAALTTAQQIKDPSSQAETLKEIAIAQANAGDVSAILTAAEQIEHLSFKAETLKEVAIAQAKAGDVTAALTTAEKIEDPDDKARALKEIAIAQAKAGDVAAAQTTLNTALLTTAEQIRDPSFKAQALVDIAIAQANAGDAAAQTALNTALTTAEQIRDPSSKAWALKEIAIAQANAGDAAAQTTLNTALTTTEKIENPYTKTRALKEIAVAQANAGDAAAALTTAEKIEDPDDKAEALIAITIAQVNAGDAAAQTTLNTALTTAEQIESPLFKTQALKEIAIAQAKAGDAAAALTTAEQIELPYDKAEALKEIAIAQVNAGDAAALTTAEQIESPLFKAQALEEIAIAQAKARVGGHAVATAEKILSGRNEHLPRIATAFVETGDRDHFKQLLIPCADYLDAAYAMCAHLIKLYPQQATAIAKVVSEFSVGKAQC
ncbi:AAA family ATPase [Cyanobacteria bacterium FACHB-471]|nr:AAA family ATPase [Cyanobacteria bacterium FACHB-471]